MRKLQILCQTFARQRKSSLKRTFLKQPIPISLIALASRYSRSIAPERVVARISFGHKVSPRGMYSLYVDRKHAREDLHFLIGAADLKILLACVAASERRLRSDPAFRVAQEYIARAQHYEPCSLQVFAREATLLEAVERLSGRSRALAILLNSRGQSLSSRKFATLLGTFRDSGQQQIVACVGPPDGWSRDAEERADLMLSLGPMTLPHALAQAVLAEQIYRALTILAGHPYHCGH